MYDYPTILVARDDGLDCSLVQSLQRNGFHVLEADDWDHLFDVVRVHSRRIHLLLLDAKNMYVVSNPLNYALRRIIRHMAARADGIRNGDAKLGAVRISD